MLTSRAVERLFKRAMYEIESKNYLHTITMLIDPPSDSVLLSPDIKSESRFTGLNRQHTNTNSPTR